MVPKKIINPKLSMYKISSGTNMAVATDGIEKKRSNTIEIRLPRIGCDAQCGTSRRVKPESRPSLVYSCNGKRNIKRSDFYPKPSHSVRKPQLHSRHCHKHNGNCNGIGFGHKMSTNWNTTNDFNIPIDADFKMPIPQPHNERLKGGGEPNDTHKTMNKGTASARKPSILTNWNLTTTEAEGECGGRDGGAKLTKNGTSAAENNHITGPYSIFNKGWNKNVPMPNARGIRKPTKPYSDDGMPKKYRKLTSTEIEQIVDAELKKLRSIWLERLKQEGKSPATETDNFEAFKKSSKMETNNVLFVPSRDLNEAWNRVRNEHYKPKKVNFQSFDDQLKNIEFKKFMHKEFRPDIIETAKPKHEENVKPSFSVNNTAIDIKQFLAAKNEDIQPTTVTNVNDKIGCSAPLFSRDRVSKRTHFESVKPLSPRQRTLSALREVPKSTSMRERRTLSTPRDGSVKPLSARQRTLSALREDLKKLNAKKILLPNSIQVPISARRDSSANSASREQRKLSAAHDGHAKSFDRRQRTLSACREELEKPTMKERRTLSTTRDESVRPIGRRQKTSPGLCENLQKLSSKGPKVLLTPCKGSSTKPIDRRQRALSALYDEPVKIAVRREGTFPAALDEAVKPFGRLQKHLSNAHPDPIKTNEKIRIEVQKYFAGVDKKETEPKDTKATATPKPNAHAGRVKLSTTEKRNTSASASRRAASGASPNMKTAKSKSLNEIKLPPIGNNAKPMYFYNVPMRNQNNAHPMPGPFKNFDVWRRS